MKILSIDVGIINFSYCVLESTKIIKWENFSFKKKSDFQNTCNLIKEMDSRPHLLDVDTVLIEKQPRCNPKMRVVAQTIITYFIMKNKELNLNINVKPYSPKHKLKCYNGPEPEFKVKSKYQQRKKMSIFHCSELIKEDQEQEFIDYFKNSKKKDDLADSFLQGLSFLMKS